MGMKQWLSLRFFEVWLIMLSVANYALGANANPRFVDNLDGTITDNQAKLMWGKKTGSIGTMSDCTLMPPTGPNCNEPTNVNNVYNWSTSTNNTAPEGTLFTVFLANLNCIVAGNNKKCGLGSYRDWRIPRLDELRSILRAESPDCPVIPCIDPSFGPTQQAYYYTFTSLDDTKNDTIFMVNFTDGFVGTRAKYSLFFARAVRSIP